jgi:predicted secreted hydrolase
VNRFDLSWPRDHGKHADFETEWWYFSGILKDAEAMEWGYHFVIFRRAFSLRLRGVTPHALPIEGYVGHLSLTNITRREFDFFQTGALSLLGFAGSREDRLDVWVRNWHVKENQGRMNIKAEVGDFGVSLELHPQSQPVLHGEGGLEIKGSLPGEASHHYSVTSLDTKGKLKWAGKEHDISGNSWMEREFGTAMIPQSILGWDWFSISMENGHQITLTRWRWQGAKAADSDFVTIISPDGTTQRFGSSDFTLESMAFWESPRTHARYPVAWQLSIPKAEIELRIDPIIKQHEILGSETTGIDYWEGPVMVNGTIHLNRASGRGYQELVGYAQPIGGKL